MRRLAAVVAVVSLAACGDPGDGGDGAAAPEAAPPTAPPDGPAAGPPGDDITRVPDPLPDGTPGDLLALRELDGDAVPDGARAWELLHLSTSVDGEPVAVSGALFAPDGPAPAGGRPVLSWGHGTTGVADACAPTRRGVVVPFLGQLLARGYVVAATDYEGLGTPGTHPYLVGESAGRSVLDGVRATSRVEGAGAGGPVVAFGHSQGGQAALFAGILAPEHAPELDLVGVVAGAPPAELRTLLRGAAAAPGGLGYLVSSAVGFAAAYDDLDLAEVLTPAALDRAAVVEEACMGEVAAAFVGSSVDDVLATDPLQVPAWARRIAGNEPGEQPVAAPVLVVQGGADSLVPAATNEAAAARLCAGGATLALRPYPGAGHTDVLGAAADEILDWIDDRVAGRSAPSTC
jgi:pimeloyl-ACP methyl ester carboxylesterase